MARRSMSATLGSGRLTSLGPRVSPSPANTEANSRGVIVPGRRTNQPERRMRRADSRGCPAATSSSANEALSCNPTSEVTTGRADAGASRRVPRAVSNQQWSSIPGGGGSARMQPLNVIASWPPGINASRRRAPGTPTRSTAHCGRGVLRALRRDRTRSVALGVEFGECLGHTSERRILRLDHTEILAGLSLLAHRGVAPGAFEAGAVQHGGVP